MPPDGGAEAGAPARMRGFAAALLRQTGALVDDIAPDGLEVLAPPPVQAALGLGEFARLGFGATLPPSAQRVGIDGDWLERFARLLGPRGHWTRRVLVDDRRAPGDPQSLLARELLLDNATWRLLDVRPAWTRYLVLAFRAAAVSNDKRDFVLRIGINLATGAVVDGMADGAEGAPPDAAELPPDWPRARLLALVGRALPPRLDAALAPFLTGLRRRLGRDLDRLHQFHADLHREAMTRAEALAGSDPRRERERLRAEAIAREYHARLDDLRRQYAARVTVTWVQTEEVIAPVHRLAVQVRRRKGERTMLLDWNVPARRLDPPTCEYTAGPERPRLVCDDALHLVAPDGMAPCAACGKPFCRACHAACPKCGLAPPGGHAIAGLG